jgi:hypothetical protein
VKSLDLVKDFKSFKLPHTEQKKSLDSSKIRSTFKNFIKKKDIIGMMIADSMKIESNSLAEIRLKSAALRKKFKEFLDQFKKMSVVDLFG